MMRWAGVLFVIAIVAACGDEPIAKPEPAPPAAFVTVTAYTRAVGDARVIYHGADGRVLRSKEGSSTKGLIESGGMITWIESSEPPYGLYTIAGVELFDKLKFVLLGDYVRRFGETRVRMPGLMPGVPFYSLENECDYLDIEDPSPDREHVLISDSVCLRGYRETIVAFARDDTGRRRGYSMKGVRLPDSYMAEVTLDPWKTDLVDLEITANNIPLDAAQLYGRMSLINNRRLIAGQVVLPEVAQNLTISFQQPPGLGGGFVYDVAAFVPEGFRQPGPYFGEYALVLLSEGRAAVDFAALGLPRINSRSVEGHMISWTIGEGENNADWIELELTWPGGRWTVFLPPNATSFELPEFPEEYAAVVPREGEFDVAFTALSDDAHYDGFEALKRDGSFPPLQSYELEELTRVRFSGR